MLIGTTQKLTAISSRYLVGRRIVEASEQHIQLDDGLRIYLEPDEVEHINEHTEPYPENDEEAN